MSETVNQPLVLKKASRSSRFASWSGNANSFRDKLFRSIYIFLLFALDLVMFIYSINGRLIEDGVINRAFLVIAGSIFVIAFVLILCFSFSRNIQNLLCALATMVAVAMFYYQFALGNVDNFLEIWFNKHMSWLSFFCIVPSPWLVGLFFGALIFLLFRFSDAILFVTLVLLFSGAIGIQKNEFLTPKKTEYEEVKNLPYKAGSDKESNIVYLMIPKFPSYQFLNTVRDPGFRELRDLMIGFYAANNFEIYPNAFIKQTDTMGNMIDILNQVDYTSTTSANRGFAEFVNDWNFIHGGLDILGLEDSRLYSYLEDNGFGVSMYAMPGFNFCLKGSNFATDRCVVKGYKIVSLYDKKASLEQNVYALLGEWVLSLQSRDFRALAKMLINASHLKNMKILAENRRVSLEGGTAIFDKLALDFKKDHDGQVYLAYIDLPSDIYIYDEYCNVKPRKDWMALKDNSLYTGGIDEKRKAYSDQAKCLIGKLQEYMDDLSSQNKLSKTDIFIQGVSPIKELAGMVGDPYNRFVTDNLVNLAMRKGRNPKFLINANICLASDFTKTLIRYQDYCYSLEDEMKKKKPEEVYNLRQNLIHNAVIRGGKISNIVVNYKDWYELYKANSQTYQEKLKREREEEQQRLQRQADKMQKEDDMPDRGDKVAPVSHKADEVENIFVPNEDMILEDDVYGEKKVPQDVSKAPEIAPVVATEENKTDNIGLNTQEPDVVEQKAQNVEVEKVEEVVPEVVTEPLKKVDDAIKDNEDNITTESQALDTKVEEAVNEVEKVQEEKATDEVEKAVAEVEKAADEVEKAQEDVKNATDEVEKAQEEAEAAVAEVEKGMEKNNLKEEVVEEKEVLEEQVPVPAVQKSEPADNPDLDLFGE